MKTGALRWSGRATDFLIPDGTVAMFDPSAHSVGASAALLREDCARELLDRHGIGTVWTVVCLKSVVRSLDPAPRYPLLHAAGGDEETEHPVGVARYMIEWFDGSQKGIRKAVRKCCSSRLPLSKAISQIRWIITVNLVVGIASVVIGVTGRYWA